MNDFWSICREVRKHLGWTQRHAAKVIGITHVHLCNIENGKADASLKLIGEMNHSYGYDLIVSAWMASGERLPPFTKRLKTPKRRS